MDVAVREFALAEEHRKDLEDLLAQLSTKERKINTTQQPNVLSVGAFHEGRLIGFAQLGVIRKTTAVLGTVEDVVVDSEYQGQGLGKGIMEKILELARREGCSRLSLTSNPERTAARALYRKIGFIEPPTTLFRLTL
jgi:GNAT superfamily N-acetyltransferase